MDRTFHRRITIQDIVTILTLAVAALCCFWQHTGPWAIAGAWLAVTALIGIERTVHTKYVITESGVLHINKGRLSRPVAIDLAATGDIIRTKDGLLRPPHIAIQTGQYSWVAVQPDNADTFMQEIDRHRWKQMAKKLK